MRRSSNSAARSVGKHKVDAAAFARLKALFEPEQLVDLVLLMGNYAGTAILLAAFDMQVAEGRPLLPVESRPSPEARA